MGAFLKRRGISREICALPAYSAALQKAIDSGVLGGIAEVQERVDALDRELDALARSSLEALYAFLGSPELLRKRPAHSVERQLADRVCGNICSGAALRPDEERRERVYAYSNAVAIISRVLFCLDRKSGRPEAQGEPGEPGAPAPAQPAGARQKAETRRPAQAGGADGEGRARHEPNLHAQDFHILPPPSSKGPLSEAVGAVEALYFPRELALCEREQRPRVLAQRVAFLEECLRYKEQQALTQAPGSAPGPAPAADPAAEAVGAGDAEHDRVLRELAEAQKEVASLLEEYSRVSSLRLEASLRKFAGDMTAKAARISELARETRERTVPRRTVGEILRGGKHEASQPAPPGRAAENDGEDDLAGDALLSSADTPREALTALFDSAGLSATESEYMLRELEGLAAALAGREGAGRGRGLFSYDPALISRLGGGYGVLQQIQEAEQYCAAALEDVKRSCASSGAPEAAEFKEVLECSEEDLQVVVRALGKLGKAYSGVLGQAVGAAAAARALHALDPEAPPRAQKGQLESLYACADGLGDLLRSVRGHIDGLQKAVEGANLLVTRLRDAPSALSRAQQRGLARVSLDEEAVAAMLKQARGVVPALSAALGEVRGLVAQVANAHAVYIDAWGEFRSAYETIVRSKQVQSSVFIRITKLKKCSICKIKDWSYMYRPDHSLYCADCRLRKMGVVVPPGGSDSESEDRPAGEGAADEAVVAGAPAPQGGEGGPAADEPVAGGEAQAESGWPEPSEQRDSGEPREAPPPEPQEPRKGSAAEEARRRQARLEQQHAHDWIKIAVSI